MTSPILVAYDPDNRDHSPVDFGAMLSRLTGAPLLVASVFKGGPVLDRLAAGTFWEELGADAEQELEHLRLELLDERIPANVRTELVEATSAAAGLDIVIEGERPWLAVYGSSHRGHEGQTRPGAAFRHALHRDRCPLAVVPRAYRPHPVAAVGAAVTQTAGGRDALYAAVAVAGWAGARLDVLTVEPPLIDGAASASPGKRHQAERHLAMETLVARAIDDGGIDSQSDTELVVGDPADALTAASETLDLLMIGSHGYGRPGLPFTGGVVHRVLSGARCPVVVLPGGAAGRALGALPEPGATSGRRRRG